MDLGERGIAEHAISELRAILDDREESATNKIRQVHDYMNTFMQVSYGHHVFGCGVGLGRADQPGTPQASANKDRPAPSFGKRRRRVWSEKKSPAHLSQSGPKHRAVRPAVLVGPNIGRFARQFKFL